MISWLTASLYSHHPYTMYTGGIQYMLLIDRTTGSLYKQPKLG